MANNLWLASENKEMKLHWITFYTHTFCVQFSTYMSSPCRLSPVDLLRCTVWSWCLLPSASVCTLSTCLWSEQPWSDAKTLVRVPPYHAVAAVANLLYSHLPLSLTHSRMLHTYTCMYIHARTRTQAQHHLFVYPCICIISTGPYEERTGPLILATILGLTIVANFCIKIYTLWYL